MQSFVIDIHAHYTPPLVFERFGAASAAFPGVAVASGAKGQALNFGGEEGARSVMPALGDLESRRQWMDANGIDHQLVGGWLESFGYELPAAEGAAWSRYLNGCMLDALKNEPRFTPLATVPLQNGKLAADVLAESLDAGFGGVMIGTLPQGSHGVLDDPALDPFWAEASRLKAPVFLHPMTFCGETRYNDYGLMNALGRSEDTSIAVSRLLFSGHLLKYPDVKLVLSHGGGTLPYVLGRLMKSWRNANGKVADPQAGFGKLYFDSCVFDAEALELLVRKAGEDRVMLGSDAPFPMSDTQPREIVERANLTAQQRESILRGAARTVFRVRADCCG